jgi:hypothetical protein
VEENIIVLVENAATWRGNTCNHRVPDSCVICAFVSIHDVPVIFDHYAAVELRKCKVSVFSERSFFHVPAS